MVTVDETQLAVLIWALRRHRAPRPKHVAIALRLSGVPPRLNSEGTPPRQDSSDPHAAVLTGTGKSCFRARRGSVAIPAATAAAPAELGEAGAEHAIVYPPPPYSPIRPEPLAETLGQMTWAQGTAGLGLVHGC